MVGKEDALFVPSGTMGNQIAVACHTRPGQEVVCETRSHVVVYEMSGMSALSGCSPRVVDGRDGGRLAWEDVRGAIRPETTANSGTGLVTVENTHNLAGGTVTPVDAVSAICGGSARARCCSPPRRCANLQRRGRARRFGRDDRRAFRYRHVLSFQGVGSAGGLALGRIAGVRDPSPERPKAIRGRDAAGRRARCCGSRCA